MEVLNQRIEASSRNLLDRRLIYNGIHVLALASQMYVLEYESSILSFLEILDIGIRKESSRFPRKIGFFSKEDNHLNGSHSSSNNISSAQNLFPPKTKLN
jgi:hypothetical protein